MAHTVATPDPRYDAYAAQAELLRNYLDVVVRSQNERLLQAMQEMEQVLRTELRKNAA
jgi:uncharacterized membrane-anchored protein